MFIHSRSMEFGVDQLVHQSSQTAVKVMKTETELTKGSMSRQFGTPIQAAFLSPDSLGPGKWHESPNATGCLFFSTT